MFLSDLRLETRQHGCVLIIRTIGQPVRIIAVVNAVEDEMGDVDRFAMYKTKTTLRPVDILPKNIVIAVKEPFFKGTADGGFVIRIDHPSDAVFLEEDHAMYPDKWKVSRQDLRSSSIAWKLEGNAALKRQDYVKAKR